MPKITVEYSSNLTSNNAFEPKELLQAINQAVAKTSVFDPTSIKSVAHCNDDFAIGVEPGNFAAIDIKIEILDGRSQETKVQTVLNVVNVIKEKVKKVPGLDIQYSVDLSEMERATFIKDTL